LNQTQEHSQFQCGIQITILLEIQMLVKKSDLTGKVFWNTQSPNLK
jgi:Tfp pilus assembly protein PilZ